MPDGAALVIAVSGGPDSVALLQGVASLAPARDWRATVAHLDHALRADSSSDVEFVRAAATELGLAFATSRVDVRALASREHRSPEDAGRRARYRFLAEVAERLGPGVVILTAHTADDQAETVLLRLMRGSGLRGVRGIPERRGNVVRPLLRERRHELRAALDEAGIGYLVDPTNLDPAFARRNAVRAEVLPALEAIDPGAVAAIARFARLAADDDDLLDAVAAAELTRRRTGEGALDWHDPPARAVGRRVLRLAIGEPATSAERIEALLDAAEGPRGGLVIQLGRGRTGAVRQRRIELQSG